MTDEHGYPNKWWEWLIAIPIIIAFYIAAFFYEAVYFVRGRR